MSTSSNSLGDALPQEIDRCVELLVQYASIGPQGRIGVTMIRAAISKALTAIAEQDLVEMIRAYEELKTIS